MGSQRFEQKDEEQVLQPHADSLRDDSETARRQLETLEQCPSTAWFLGPKAEQGDLWESLFTYVFRDYVHWRRNYYPGDPVTISRRQKALHEDWLDELHSRLDCVLGELKAHFPFYSPRYIGHMLSEQTLPSVIGYFAGMLYNPNNVTAEAAPVTVQLELEVGRFISEMLGFDPEKAWAHICSGGTVANLEALWVARLAQFAPFIAREICRELNYEFKIEAPPEESGAPQARALKEVGDRVLLSLPPSTSVPLFRRLASWAVETHGTSVEKIVKKINDHLESSEYSVSEAGYGSVLARLKLKPVLIVSEAAHYSVQKAAEVLGYGKRAVRTVPVRANFRVDIESLEKCLRELREDEYLAGVIAIAGTTEEGSVDPVHEIVALRDRLWVEKGQSFWLHVDAAWGGYLTSLLHTKVKTEEQPLKEFLTRQVVPRLEGEALFEETEVTWAKTEVEKAIRAIHQADSVTIDPHKMGYIPYPAGVVCFRSALVTELIQQKAQYISDDSGGVKAVDQPATITSVGPFTLEGSRPGAAASAVWLSHKMIPLCREGHGKLIRDSLLAARTLWTYLQKHAQWAETFSRFAERDPQDNPCAFEPLYEPDTNVVCFVARPAARVGGKLRSTDLSLKELNNLNQEVYARLSLQTKPTYRGMTRAYSYSQPFFVSRTWITPEQYHPDSVKELLERLGVEVEEYKENGLFVLRSTVMNPLLLEAQKQGKDYILEFLLYLHITTSEILAE